MSAAALRSSARYDPAVVAERYESLFTRLRAARGHHLGGLLRGAAHRGRARLLGPASGRRLGGSRFGGGSGLGGGSWRGGGSGAGGGSGSGGSPGNGGGPGIGGGKA
jgi:hypothetical protein